MAEEEEDVIECTPFEREIFDTLNEIRRDPSGAIVALEKKLDTFVGETNKMKVNAVSYVMTHEGKAAVNEAIAFLKLRKKEAKVAEELIWSDEAANVCSVHTERGKQNPDVVGLIPQSDHENFKALFQEEFGGEEKVGGHAECHEYGSTEPLEVLLTLIIDDGNPSRSNRKHIFGKWDYVGLNSKEIPSFKRMTSILFVIAEDTVQRELTAAVSVAEELLGIKEMKWARKKVAVAYGENNEVIVKITLSFKDGPDKVLTHKMAE